MAFIAIKLTHSGRLSYSLLFLVLMSVQSMCSITSLCTGLYVFFYVGNGLLSYSKSQVNILSLYLIAMSVIIFLVSATGFKYNKNLIAQPTNHATTHVHWIWLSFSLTMVLFLLLFSLILSELDEQLIISLTLSLNHGLTHYYSDKSWKSMMDYLHYYHKCCGVQQYTDWYHISWLPVSELPQDPDLLDKYAQSNSLVLVPLVPFTCCKSSATPLCGEKSLSSNKSTTGWNEIKPTDPSTIHTQGCLPILLNSLKSSSLAIRVLLLVVIFLQCIIIVISRYLFTATQNSIVLGNPYGSSIGWLCGRGDFCWKCGKTVPECYSEIFPVNGVKTRICKQAKCEGKIKKNQTEHKVKGAIDKVKSSQLKYIGKLRRKSDRQVPKQSDNEVSDSGNKSHKLTNKFKNFLANKKLKSFTALKKSVGFSNSDDKQTLLDQSADETDFTGDESVSKEIRPSDKIKSGRLSSQRHNVTLDMINLEENYSDTNPNEECYECEKYAFGPENMEYPKKSQDTLKSKKSDNYRGTINNEKREYVQPPTPPPPNLIDFNDEIKDEQVSINVDKDNLNSTNYENSYHQDQKVYLSLIQNRLQKPKSYKEMNENESKACARAGIKDFTENFNVQTQTSQSLFRNENKEIQDQWQEVVNENKIQPVQPLKKESSTVVFKNYRIPPNNGNYARKNYFRK